MLVSRRMSRRVCCSASTVTVASRPLATVQQTLTHCLSSFLDNALPELVNRLLQCRAGLGTLRGEILLGRAAQDEEVLLGHATHNGISIEQLGGLADRSDARLRGAGLGHVDQLASLVEREGGGDLAVAACHHYDLPTDLSPGRLGDDLDGVLLEHKLVKAILREDRRQVQPGAGHVLRRVVIPDWTERGAEKCLQFSRICEQMERTGLVSG